MQYVSGAIQHFGWIWKGIVNNGWISGQPELDNQYIPTNSASVPMMVGSPQSQWQYYGGQLGQTVSK